VVQVGINVCPQNNLLSKRFWNVARDFFSDIAIQHGVSPVWFWGSFQFQEIRHACSQKHVDLFLLEQGTFLNCFRSGSWLWDIVGIEIIHAAMSLGHSNKGRTPLIPIARVSKLGIVGRITLDSLLEILGLDTSWTRLPGTSQISFVALELLVEFITLLRAIHSPFFERDCTSEASETKVTKRVSINVHVLVEPHSFENPEHCILLQDMSNDLLELKLEVIGEVFHRMRVAVSIVACWLARKSIDVGCRALDEVA
jgi:hypothetical protein